MIWNCLRSLFQTNPKMRSTKKIVPILRNSSKN